MEETVIITAQDSEESAEIKTDNVVNNTTDSTPVHDYDGMRSEISVLRERLDKIDSRAGFLFEVRSLLSLVPDADLRTLDDEAYEAIEKGENLLYAYLLCEKRRLAASEANRKNAIASTGNADGGDDGLFTIEEIKNMDRKTVRRNFDKVMRSLERGI